VILTASHHGRIVAITTRGEDQETSESNASEGGEIDVWASDDGSNWEKAARPPEGHRSTPHDGLALAGSDLGWVILDSGGSPSTGGEPTAWVSKEGSVWQQLPASVLTRYGLPVPGVFRPEAVAVTNDRIVAMGQYPPHPQYGLQTFVWIGTPTTDQDG
jgi:hypothetical protein